MSDLKAWCRLQIKFSALSFQNEIRHIFCSSRPSLSFRKCTFLLSQAATASLAVVNIGTLRRVLSTVVSSSQLPHRFREGYPMGFCCGGCLLPAPAILERVSHSSLTAWKVQLWPWMLRLAAKYFFMDEVYFSFQCDSMLMMLPQFVFLDLLGYPDDKKPAGALNGHLLCKVGLM